jgi:hypothetical protein
MDAPSESRSAWLRFVDNFLQDRNIKWILAIGMAILLGSSLMLVSRQWEGYTVTLKQLVVLAYTAVIYIAGRWAHDRLALRRTGNMLLALTVMLLPVALAALRWVWLAEAEGTVLPGSTAVLLALNVGFAVVAARGVFGHFLRSGQPTFMACYLLLGLAGAIVPLADPAWAVWIALTMWGLFAIGTAKVNRHVFWLVEERRAPRICGFFPIGLLGTQFLTIYAAWLSPHVAIDWMGLGCVLVALPVLLAADALAAVFQQRTGNLVRPLPWSIGLPLTVGLLLCVTGVTLSAAGLIEGHHPFSLPPTAALAAVLLAGVARRTDRQEFVWGMLAMVTLAYRYCPVFFAELVRVAIQQAAAAVYEPKLPLAYYGLTFLPLLGTLMLASGWLSRRGRELFATPLRHYSIAVAMLLLGASLTHPKALFPVAAAMTGLFALQARLFRNRALALPGLTAWFLAAWGLPTFLDGVLAHHSQRIAALAIPDGARLTSLTVAAGVLLVFGALCDRRLRNWPLRFFGDEWRWGAGLSGRLCQLAGLLTTLGLGGAWLACRGWALEGLPGWPTGGALAVMLAIQALIWVHASIGFAAIAFATACGGLLLWQRGTDADALVSLLTLQWLGQWLLGYVLRLFPTWRISRAFAMANELFCVLGLSLSLTLVYLPLCLADAAGSWLPAVAFGPWWIARALIVAWAFDAARRQNEVGLGALGFLATMATVGSAAIALIGPDAQRWLPLAWVATACVPLPFARALRPRMHGIGGPLCLLSPGVLFLAATISLPMFDTAWRATGVLAAAALVLWSSPRQASPLRSLSLALLNWQLLATLAAVIEPRLDFASQLMWRGAADAWLPLAAAAAGSIMAWSFMRAPEVLANRDLVVSIDRGQRVGLRALFGLALVASLQLSELDMVAAVLAVAAFAWLTISELCAACRQHSVVRVWTAQAAALAGVGYLAAFGVIHFGRGLSMFAILGTGLLLWVTAGLAARRPTTAILAGPFRLTGHWLPLVAVMVGIGRHLRIVELADGRPHWLGMNSLAILLAAGFYFWQGIERGSKRRIVLSAAIVNVALALLWRELSFSDPQFFMIPLGITVVALVELLKREIPAAMHNPLRYIGALVVLVSPTFQITQGSWLHLFTLMLASVAVVLVAMGLRVRALMYTGTAFLAADVVAMVVRGTIDHPQMLWVAGLTFGAAVLGLGAACELHRERILQRLRAVAAVLETWE